MPVLPNYHHFAGRHWETGSVCNYYAYRGVTAPHTGQPYSEALLLGVSGGIVMGYFSFAYQGFDSHVAMLTRNTFDPLDRLLERLGVDQEVLQTAKPERGLRNLVETLEAGLPAITWADVFSLPYNGHRPEESRYWWQMFPILVYGYDEAQDQVWIADRASVPLTVTTAELAAARARVKIDKFRVMTLGAPDPEKLASAVHKGVWDTIRLYTEEPPKGSRENFGFAAYKRWCELLTNPKAKNSWARVFPPGRKLFAGLASAYLSMLVNGDDGRAERRTYAAFLEEASQILNRPALRDAAERFRDAGAAWESVGRALLPDQFPALKTMREAIARRHRLFIDQGGAAAAELQQLDRQVEEIKAAAEESFPLSEGEVQDLLANLRACLMQVSEVEQGAVALLQKAIIDA